MLVCWISCVPAARLCLLSHADGFAISVVVATDMPIDETTSTNHCGIVIRRHHHWKLFCAFCATHGLSCRRSEGRHFRHSSLNDIVHRALSAAKIPSRLEPSGTYRRDGKRPDGITMVPWEYGKLLVWDVTCTDTFAPSYQAKATSEAGAVAALAESKKRTKYCNLDPSHFFQPVAVETSGSFGPETFAFLKELGRRVRRATGEMRSFPFLIQRLAVAIQRGNCACVMGSLGSDSNPDDFFC